MAIRNQVLVNSRITVVRCPSQTRKNTVLVPIALSDEEDVAIMPCHVLTRVYYGTLGQLIWVETNNGTKIPFSRSVDAGIARLSRSRALALGLLDFQVDQQMQSVLFESFAPICSAYNASVFFSTESVRVDCHQQTHRWSFFVPRGVLAFSLPVVSLPLRAGLALGWRYDADEPLRELCLGGCRCVYVERRLSLVLCGEPRVVRAVWVLSSIPDERIEALGLYGTSVELPPSPRWLPLHFPICCVARLEEVTVHSDASLSDALTTSVAASVMDHVVFCGGSLPAFDLLVPSDFVSELSNQHRIFSARDRSIAVAASIECRFGSRWTAIGHRLASRLRLWNDESNPGPAEFLHAVPPVTSCSLTAVRDAKRTLAVAGLWSHYEAMYSHWATGQSGALAPPQPPAFRRPADPQLFVEGEPLFIADRALVAERRKAMPAQTAADDNDDDSGAVLAADADSALPPDSLCLGTGELQYVRVAVAGGRVVALGLDACAELCGHFARLWVGHRAQAIDTFVSRERVALSLAACSVVRRRDNKEFPCAAVVTSDVDRCVVPLDLLFAATSVRRPRTKEAQSAAVADAQLVSSDVKRDRTGVVCIQVAGVRALLPVFAAATHRCVLSAKVFLNAFREAAVRHYDFVLQSRVDSGDFESIHAARDACFRRCTVSFHLQQQDESDGPARSAEFVWPVCIADPARPVETNATHATGRASVGAFFVAVMHIPPAAVLRLVVEGAGSNGGSGESRTIFEGSYVVAPVAVAEIKLEQ